jgi:arylsulfatase A-like enzyme
MNHRINLRKRETLSIVAAFPYPHLMSIRSAPLVILFALSLPACKEKQPPSILMVVLDTTRADATGRELTPALAGLAREGVAFENARSTSAWTLPAHGSLFTGLFPSRHGAHHESHRLAPGLTTLAEHLSRTHDCAAFTENPHVSMAKGFAQGFSHFDELFRRMTSLGPVPDTEGRAARWIEEHHGRRPFFVFVNLMDPHLPYHPPARFRTRLIGKDTPKDEIERLSRMKERRIRRHITGSEPLSDDELEILRQLYQAEVSFSDSRLDVILDALRRKNLMKHTLVIALSDHGENLGEHGLMDHQLCLYETLLRIPLVMRLPGVFEGGRKRTDPVQLVDVMPTILDVVKAPRPSWPSMEGDSLASGPVSADRPVIAEYMRPVRQQRWFAKADPAFDFSRFNRRLRSVQAGELKLILPERGEPELYQLTRDPGELENLSSGRPDEVKRLSVALDGFLRARNAAPTQAEPDLDSETKERLRSLGYVE